MESLAEESRKQVCEACSQATERGKYLGDRLCDRCTMVMWTAQALLDNDYDSPQHIIPTIVFGAISVDDVRLEELSEALATIEWGSERGRRLRSRFHELFKYADVWALVDGVPIIRQDPIQVVYEHSDEEDQRIAIDVTDVSVRPMEVSARYKESLAAFGLDKRFSEEGG